MKCERCQVDMQPRKVEYHGREYDFPYCEKCESEMQAESDKLKERRVRKRTDSA